MKANGKCRLARSLLSDIPDALFQIVLQHLTSQDVVGLRLVSHSVCKHTTHNAPHIILRLSGGSSTQQVQQWFQVTQPFQHVSKLHLLVTGKVSADVFESAMQLLSQCRTVLELHLLAAAGCFSSNKNNMNFQSCISTLQPLQHVMPQLLTLVIEGIAVQDMVNDLKQLSLAAPVGGWRLQNLTLYGYWSNLERTPIELHSPPCLWSRFASAVRQLAIASPRLQQLSVQIPRLGYSYNSDAVNDEDLRRAAEEGVGFNTAADGAAQVLDAAKLFQNRDAYLSVNKRGPKVKAATALVAAVVALFNTTLQLRHLRMLRVTDAPDIWGSLQHPLIDSWLAEYRPVVVPWEASAVAIAAKVVEERAEVPPEASTAASESATGAELLRMSTAVTALATLDGSSSWLFQHHRTLEEMHLSTPGGWSMSWQRDQQQQDCSHDSRTECNRLAACSASAAPHLLEASVNWHQCAALCTRQAVFQHQAGVNVVNLVYSCHSKAFPSTLISHLSHYSSRSALYVMQHISRCQLVLEYDDVTHLSDLLTQLRSLKQLEIKLKCIDPLDNSTSSHAAEAAIQAVAALSGLQSSSLCVTGSMHEMPDGLLLPLTTATKGPGSTLQKLELSGDFTDASDSTDGAVNTSVASSSSCLQGLKLMDGLRQLKLNYSGQRSRCRFLVDYLPPNLQVFAAERLIIVATKDDDSDDAESIDSTTGYKSTMLDLYSSAAMPNLQLQQLHLKDCQLSSPGILATHKLKQLTISDSSWSGGWAAAARAWPSLRELVWKGDRGSILSNNRSRGGGSNSKQKYVIQGAHNHHSEKASDNSGRNIQTAADVLVSRLLADSSTADKVLQILCTEFRSLASLTMQNLPWLDVKVIRAALQHMVQPSSNLKHILMAVDETEYVMAECEGLNTFSKVYRHWGCMQAVRSRLGRSNSGIDLGAKLEDLQTWLQQQMPWANIAISAGGKD